MEDKKISEAIRLLYKGAKMLPYHCPECGIPIFKYEDKMICPSCGKEAVFESELKEKGIILNKIDNATKTSDEEGMGEKIGEEVVSKGNIQRTQGTPLASVKDVENVDKLVIDKTIDKTSEGKSNSEEVKSKIQLENSKKHELEDYKVFKQALKLKLNDISRMLLDADSPSEIERILNLSERIISLLREVEKECR